MPKSFRHLVQALACLALLASASLQAQESRLDRILESGVLRVATTGDYKPFSYRTEEGGYAGFDVDMAQRLAESLGAKLVVVPTSWPNLMRDFADDRFDIAMSGISINLERQRQADLRVDPQRREERLTQVAGLALGSEAQGVRTRRVVADMRSGVGFLLVQQGGQSAALGGEERLQRLHLDFRRLADGRQLA